MKTLVDILRLRAINNPSKVVYSFVKSNNEIVDVTYEYLDRRARALGFVLQQELAQGERVLLFLPHGPEYITTFFACLYAGLIAIPIFPPRKNRTEVRIESIIASADPKLAISTANIISDVSDINNTNKDLFSRMSWLDIASVEETFHEHWEMPNLEPSSVAFLQYTSGSTTSPRGVIITHHNVLSNLKLIEKATGTHRDCRGVSWLPFYHDMGLVTGVLQPIYNDFHLAFLSPFDFLQTPVKWLKTISDFGATHSGGPNFAYELCNSKIPDDLSDSLDLSKWRVAFNGAEPIRVETLERFSNKFARYGFKRKSFLACYGLAESTVGVSWSSPRSFPKVATVNQKELEQNGNIVVLPKKDLRSKQLVGCGIITNEPKVIIVNPSTRAICSPGNLGEIWITGESVASGYWEAPDATKETFHAYTDQGEGPFLRTEDQGFILDGELYVTGRLKDMIIIRGENYYPQDIEFTVEKSHPSLRSGAGAVISVEINGEERLVVLQELERHYPKDDLPKIISCIRQSIAEKHELRPPEIFLLRYESIPKTSSGKVQRYLCRQKYLNGDLNVIYKWDENQYDNAGYDKSAAKAAEISSIKSDFNILVDFLTVKLSEKTKIDRTEINIRSPFARYGLDSLVAVRLAEELGNFLGQKLSPVIFYEYPTIETLSTYLSSGKNIQSYNGISSNRDGQLEPIAIIGLGCRFPGAENPDALWKLLVSEKDAISEIPVERFGELGNFQQIKTEKYSKYGGFLQGIDLFDANFFGISPREASQIDPQHRLLLEVSWEALEDAGQVPSKLAGTKTGVFIGISNTDYGQFQFGDLDSINAYTGTGSALSIAANRISYFYDFHGPSIAVDTACSSSLVAVHLACSSIWSGESELAISGGINLILSPALGINFSQASVMSPDGRCKAFDARANGYVRSEGVGLVILKPLSKAIEDKDDIYAVIKGSAVNQDGRTNGIMAPNKRAQINVLISAYDKAGISPEKVSYIETHGTGTLLGDTIEAEAIADVLGSSHSPDNCLMLGSIKTNIGHLEAAAGIAGLIKTALILKNKVIPSNLHFKTPNPNIDFSKSNLRVQDHLFNVPENVAFIAGVSSFGFGGTNAHVVMQNIPISVTEHGESMTGGKQIFTISAQNEKALFALVAKYKNYLQDIKNLQSLSEICYSSNVRRQHHEHRLAILANSIDEILIHADSFLENRIDDYVLRGELSSYSSNPESKMVFVFSGHGSQWSGMGRLFYKIFPEFRSSMEKCDFLIHKYGGFSIVEEMLTETREMRLDEIDIIQPLLFSLQVSFAALWQSLGIKPSAVVGHSFGEIAAAYISGILSLEDASLIICERSKLLKKISGKGGMALLGISREQASEEIQEYNGRISIAALNSQNSTIVSGELDDLKSLLQKFAIKGIFCSLVKVNAASHSYQIDPLSDTLIYALENIKPQLAQIPFYSTVSGTYDKDLILDGVYWKNNLRQPVLFQAAVDNLLDQGYSTFLEISPHPILLSSIQQEIEHYKKTVVLLATMSRSDDLSFFRTLSSLYVSGFSVNWRNLYEKKLNFVHLPGYCWQRERYWLSKGSPRKTLSSILDIKSDPFKSQVVYSADSPNNVFWQGEISGTLLDVLADHKVQQVTLIPGSLYIEAALTAAKMLGYSFNCIENMEFKKGIYIEDNDQLYRLQVHLTASDNEIFRIKVFSSKDNKEWDKNAEAHLLQITTHDVRHSSPKEIQSTCSDFLSHQDCYSILNTMGLNYGPSFKGVKEIWRSSTDALGLIEVPETLRVDISNSIHPAVLATCLATIAFPKNLQSLLESANAMAFLPTKIERFAFYQKLDSTFWCHAHLKECSEREVKGDFWILNEQGCVVAEVLGVQFNTILKRTELSSAQEMLYELVWYSKGRNSNQVSDDKPKIWLIFSDEQGIGFELKNLIGQMNQKVVLITKGQYYEMIDQNSYIIRPNEIDDLYKVFDSAFARDDTPINILHLWGIDSPLTKDLSPHSLIENQQIGCLSINCLAQVLVARKFTQFTQLWVITQDVQPVQKESIRVSSSPIWGFCRTLAKELNHIWGGIIDLDGNTPVAIACHALLQEILASDGEDQIVFRGDKRYAPRIIKKAMRNLGHSNPICKPDSTYLITGGTGDLGLELAKWLVENEARRLILLSHTSIPSRNKWKNYKQDPKIVKIIAQILQLEAKGAQIDVAVIDVCDQKKMQAFFRQYKRQCRPPIRGIIHAAGVVNFNEIVTLDADAFLKVLYPKIAGAWLLHKLFEKQDLDFFILFSSVASLIGSPFLSSYAAANSFLDSFAQYRSLKGQPGLSVNWGPWADIGMAARFQQINQRNFMSHSLESMEPRLALNVLENLMRNNSVQAMVAPINWAKWRSTTQTRGEKLLFSAITETDTNHSLETTDNISINLSYLLNVEEKEQVEVLKSYLSRLIAKVLRIPENHLSTTRPLTSLGIDSLMAVEMKNRIELDLGISIPLVLFLQGPNINAFTDQVLLMIRNNTMQRKQEAMHQVSSDFVNDHLDENEIDLDIDSLSDEDVDRLLREMLNGKE